MVICSINLYPELSVLTLSPISVIAYRVYAKNLGKIRLLKGETIKNSVSFAIHQFMGCMTDHRIKNNPLSSVENKQRSFSNIRYMVFFTYFTIYGVIITGLYQVTLHKLVYCKRNTIFNRFTGVFILNANPHVTKVNPPFWLLLVWSDDNFTITWSENTGLLFRRWPPLLNPVVYVVCNKRYRSYVLLLLRKMCMKLRIKRSNKINFSEDNTATVAA
jgi:hypothetical protein